ncbi:hypothetical protein SBRY_20957 [Actinacidiphila bryophytorum]|uniref:Uncharacterized protein n=1 Tax=Actinacidiphila bryophytorum TaxID=1436133 RepID=A0A9W4GZW0_9ACTN|nr:hypothetical protein SBRY_20957 [Actinacidiphila bryophytorum]
MVLTAPSPRRQRPPGAPSFGHAGKVFRRQLTLRNTDAIGNPEAGPAGTYPGPPRIIRPGPIRRVRAGSAP